MNKKEKKAIFRIFILLTLILTGYTYYSFDSESVKIANWNLQIFGQSKANDLSLINSYVEKIDDYDIIFIQEIRDSSETAFPFLCSFLENYSCVSSSRAGRSSSKEQYGIIYKKGINLTYFKDYNPDESDRWERPPIETSFNINGYEITMYNIHTKPDDVQEELFFLEQIVSNHGNILVLGDLNADCSYYNNEKNSEFENWEWLISDNQDTTISKTDCAYDRILLNQDSYEDVLSYGIEKDINSEMSDHYLVWVELKIE